jgi:hypothetical protein
MKERILNSTNPNKNVDTKKLSGSFIRHSKSSYATYNTIRKSEEPLSNFNPDQQTVPDLTPEGVELAHKEAESFFSNLNSDETSLFFVSSNEARAIETADIYREIAHNKGFDVIKTEHASSKLSENNFGGEIRILKNLSIYPNKSKVVFDGMFNPKKYRGEINWEKIPNDINEKYKQAVEIIDADDQGSFVANFAKYAERIKEIIPEIDTPEELFKSKFQHLIRLLKRGESTMKKNPSDKLIKVLAFGHENYLIYFLQKYLGKENIGNCEFIDFTIDNGTVKISNTGKQIEI